MKLSAMALSYGQPARLMLGWMPRLSSSAMYSVQAYWADSSGRRNSLFSPFLIDGLEQLVQCLGRSFPTEGFSRSCIQSLFDWIALSAVGAL